MNLNSMLLSFFDKNKKVERKFNSIYEDNLWGGEESISGPGSDLKQTKKIVETLPIITNKYGIRSILDAPCGDFHWMSRVNLNVDNYYGYDIVKEIVEDNKKYYSRKGVSFSKSNIITDPLPKVDLIICRDCLVHFSFEDISSTVSNFCNSGSKYLLTTTFTDRKENKDIRTGDWRPLNLKLQPFNFPDPILIVNEGCTEVNHSFSDKCLALWDLKEINRKINYILNFKK